MKTLLALSIAWVALQANLSSETIYREVEVVPPYKVEIYTALFCGHCKAAKKVLKSYKISYEEEGIIFNGKNHKEMLSRTFGEDGAPRIFINNWYIGTRRDLDQFTSETLSAIADDQATVIRVKIDRDRTADR
tara:strand:- start:46 stop:444 length:399 start_codon:yes stop_codon:yes gene_type:complete